MLSIWLQLELTITGFTFTYLKLVAMILLVAVLFQSCKVYYKEPTTIDQAIGSDKKQVKVIMNDDRIYVFDSIYYKNDVLFGLLHLSKGKARSFEVKINQENIESIYVLNIRKSSTLSVIVGFGIFFGFLGLIILIGLTTPFSIGW